MSILRGTLLPYFRFVKNQSIIAFVFGGMLLLAASLPVCSQVIKGKVKGIDGKPIPFASITVKGTTINATTNEEGQYKLALKPANCTLVCRSIDHQPAEKYLDITQESLLADFILTPQSYITNNSGTIAGTEDPAYEIIHKAIAKRHDHDQELSRVQCDIYIKGCIKLRNYPKRVFGKKTFFEDGNTSKQRILYLSEMLARYSADVPGKSKIEISSTNISGNINPLGLSMPQIISFYKNTIHIGEDLNPRGFISPIADNAFHYYDYILEGSFTEKNTQIDRIRVIPKRKFEPLFKGYIYIMEDEWRITGLKLQLEKDQNLQILDSMEIEQVYMPLGNTWVVSQQVIYPTAKLFGFDAYGHFIQTFSNFDRNPHFPEKFFDNVVLNYDSSTTNKTTASWNSMRPVPLSADEAKDFRIKDSLDVERKRPAYLDSIDRLKNRPSLLRLFVLGQTFVKDKRTLAIHIPAVYNLVDFNTAEGWLIRFSPSIEKVLKRTDTLRIIPTVRYGFSNQHFNAHITGSFSHGKKYLNTFYFSAGSRVFQFNNDQPITLKANTISTLLRHYNYLKTYQAAYGMVGFKKNIGDNFTMEGIINYQDRTPLNNTTDYSWSKKTYREYTPNYPEAISSENIPRHQALSATFNIKWQPGTKYIQLSERKISLGSKYPSVETGITQGIYGFLGSDVQYSKWILSMSGKTDFNLAGRLNYKAAIGGFLNTDHVYTPDYQHFNGNQLLFASPYMHSFQLMPYYDYSTIADLYLDGHFEYHLNGLLTNKIPLLRRLNWFLVTGGNAIWINANDHYFEAFVSLENIFKVIRVDFIQGFSNKNGTTSGIRLQIPIVTGSKEL